MSSSVAQFAAKMERAARRMAFAERQGVTEACKAAKVTMLSSARTAGINGRLSGVGAKGARVGVRYDVKGVDNPVGIVQWYGPIHLAAFGTKAHDIKPKKKKALSPSGNPWAAASAHVRGTSGKHFAEPAFAIVVASAPRIVENAVKRELLSIF